MNKPVRKRIAVVGLGYVGLPLAISLSEHHDQVLGIDIDTNKIKKLSESISYLSDVSNEAITSLKGRGFTATSSFKRVKEVDTIILCVPTPLIMDQSPDLSYVQTAMKSLLPYIKKGTLIVLESSTFPGTTEEVLIPLCEQENLIVGEDVYIAYSPERINPGDSSYLFKTIPKVISGVTPQCLEEITQLYTPVFDQLVPVSSPRVAEMTKLLENTQRFINISFINEMARICHDLDIDVWEVLDAAKTKPYGYSHYEPGPGIGGHCIPVDPLYLKWKANQSNIQTDFIDLAKRINDAQPYYIASRVQSLLHNINQKDASVLLVGISYKKDVNDLRQSIVPLIARQLRLKGMSVSFHDPYIEHMTIDQETLTSIPLTPETLARHTLVLITADHSCLDYNMITEHSNMLFDTRNCPIASEKPIERL
ncbi:UDP-N-acetyl-D-glucosamine dehydrogenase [Shouchella lonarensis]|uniref:UDP-N-acetyl-D-glucosamine dehydrogenase n=1 Tax=Shouchella lonarensis TaxID=1464122 RepID=A0A1G6GLW2_9BACI|nr:UDP-N-acetyl-D-glucosamine dehydrogenase [Shouchella lonarensis]